MTAQLQLALQRVVDETDLPLNGAIISLDSLYRYVLTRTWDPSLPSLVFCMLNPSVADAAIDDPTLRKCCGFARKLGFGGVTIVNKYAYRTPYPSDLLRARRKGIDIVGPENDAWIRRVFASSTTKSVVCAWGGRSPSKHRTDQVLQIARDVGAILYAIGVNQHGNTPRHPLMTPYATPMTEWRP